MIQITIVSEKPKSHKYEQKVFDFVNLAIDILKGIEYKHYYYFAEKQKYFFPIQMHSWICERPWSVDFSRQK